jgi:hypothetical protein
MEDLMPDHRITIRRPGPRKLARWQTALHEAGHAVAFTELCGTWAHAKVFSDGRGICSHGRAAGTDFNLAVAIAAGDAAGWWAWAIPCPAGRPQQVRGRFPVGVRSDVAQVAAIMRRGGDETGRSCVPFSVGDVEQVANRFFWEYQGDILRCANKVFLRGHHYLQAPPKRNPVVENVSPDNSFFRAAIRGER